MDAATAIKIAFISALCGFANIVLNLDPKLPPAMEIQEGPVYDMTKIKAPVSSGTVMRALKGMLSVWPISSLLASYLYKDAGFTVVRTFAASHLASTDITPLPIHFVPNPVPAIPEEHVAQVVSQRLQSLCDALGDASDLSASASSVFPSALDYAKYYKSGGSPVDIAKRLLELMAASKTHSPPLAAFLFYNATEVMQQAEESARRFKNGNARSVLEGVPVAIKNEMDVKGFPTKAGTVLFGDRPAERDATVVSRLRAQGAIILCVTNMHEYGAGVTGHNTHFGPARNPYNLAHATGGSSSGSAAAVSAGFVPLALGGDGGGSVRLPAALTGIYGIKATFGIYGIKATFGRVSHHGAFPICWSVGHIGALAATARDLAIAYLTLAGPDQLDRFSQHQPPIALPDLTQSNGNLATISAIYRDASQILPNSQEVNL
eukprot:g32192.t1